MKRQISLRGRGASTPLVRPEPLCGLGNSFFKEELKRLLATRRDRLWRDTGGQIQAKELSGDWNFWIQSVHIGLSRTRLKRITTDSLTRHCMQSKHSRIFNLVENASCKVFSVGEETLLNLFSRCDPVITKISRNLAQH